MNKMALQIPISFKEKLVEEMLFLNKFARKFASDSKDIEDLVQDTILKAMLCFDKFKFGTNLKGWLYVLMRNIYINNYRKQNLFRKFSEMADDNQLFCSTKHTNENGGAEKLICSDIKAVINKLKPIESMPFKLYVSGFKYRQIAGKLQIPMGTVKTRIYVARTKLKNILNDYPYLQ